MEIDQRLCNTINILYFGVELQLIGSLVNESYRIKRVQTVIALQISEFFVFCGGKDKREYNYSSIYLDVSHNDNHDHDIFNVHRKILLR